MAVLCELTEWQKYFLSWVFFITEPEEVGCLGPTKRNVHSPSLWYHLLKSCKPSGLKTTKNISILSKDGKANGVLWNKHFFFLLCSVLFIYKLNFYDQNAMYFNNVLFFWRNLMNSWNCIGGVYCIHTKAPSKSHVRWKFLLLYALQGIL